MKRAQRNRRSNIVVHRNFFMGASKIYAAKTHNGKSEPAHSARRARGNYPGITSPVMQKRYNAPWKGRGRRKGLILSPVVTIPDPLAPTMGRIHSIASARDTVIRTDLWPNSPQIFRCSPKNRNRIDHTCRQAFECNRCL